MTNSDYTHITLVVDRSGSMEAVKSDAQGGLNSLLTEQYALDGKLTVTLVEFDSVIETVARMSTEPLDYILNPRNMTALLDAVGSEIEATGKDLEALPEESRPARVLFVVVTDGEENSSHQYTLGTVREMVNRQRDEYNWVFQFIGAGDSAWQGQHMGMDSSAYVASGDGNRTAYAVMNAATKDYRLGAVFSMPASIPEELDGTDEFEGTDEPAQI